MRIIDIEQAISVLCAVTVNVANTSKKNFSTTMYKSTDCPVIILVNFFSEKYLLAMHSNGNARLPALCTEDEKNWGTLICNYFRCVLCRLYV